MKPGGDVSSAIGTNTGAPQGDVNSPQSDLDLDFLLLSFEFHFTVQWEQHFVSVA